MKPKQLRIFNKLKEAKAVGVLEVDLLDKFERKGNTRVIKYRLNKALGKGSVYTKKGKWYLDKSYWDLSPADFRDIMLMGELGKSRKIVFFSVIVAFISISLLAILISLTIEISWLN